jgi:hypothetical protein
VVGYINGKLAMGAERWRRLNHQVPFIVVGAIAMAAHAAYDWHGFIEIMSRTCNVHSC